MNQPSTVSVEAAITQLLTQALHPVRLIVENESHHHAGHMGDDGSGESHFAVEVESAAFAGLNRVQRQRLVNQALAGLLATRIHALRMKVRAPGE
jgi:BolA protein